MDAAFGFLLGFVTAFLGLYFFFALIIPVSGGTFLECDRGDCGSVGNWWFDHQVLVLLTVVLTLALLCGYLAARRRIQRAINR